MKATRGIVGAALLVFLAGCSQNRSHEAAVAETNGEQAATAFAPEPIVNPRPAFEEAAGTAAARNGRGLEPDPAMAVVCEKACATEAPYDEKDLVLQPLARPGDLTCCPVSGVVFEVRKNNAHHVSGGETWYTCCGTCIRKLEADPKRFIGS